MAKAKTSAFFCQNCGYESSKWMGQCPACREWNTFVEELVDRKALSTSGKIKPATEAKPVPLSAIKTSDEERISTSMPELDRVLGGGVVKGSLVLVGGDPGIGKSTLLLQVCRNLSGQNLSVLYVSGEESLQQIKLRAERIGTFSDHLELLCETSLDTIRTVIERNKPQIVVIDSIQTMYNENVSSAPGSVSQVRESTGVLMQIAKGMDISIFIVGHVTKEGVVAGPRVLEHMVDTVLYFEGDRHESYRILRGVKNRFGSTNEIGVFEMRTEGLVEVENPSEYMLSGKPKDASGSVVACSIEGTRPILLEIQALICHSYFNNPRRTATGTDFNRVNLLMAVLEKRIGMQLSDCDAYVNIAGGIRMNEPAIDLGIVLAIMSSKLDLTIDEKTICFGEVGLSGEVRGVSMAEQRVAEAAKLGFEVCILPKVSLPSVGKKYAMKLRPVLAVGGTHFVVYNRAGSELTVCSRTRTLYTQRFDEDILLCAMSNNNSLAVVTDADRFAGWVHIYDPSMRELYSWRMPQSMGTPIALDFAPDNRRFASGMIAARDGQLNCSVYFMSLDSDTEGLLYTADAGSMLLRLDWQSENRVMAVFDTYIAVIDPRTAAEVARYDYGGAALQSVAPGRRQTALLLNVHGGNSLVTLSESLTVMSEIPARQAFAVSATDTDIYLLCPDAVECYGYDGVQNWVQPGLPSRPLAVLHGKQTLVFTGSQADVLLENV